MKDKIKTIKVKKSQRDKTCDAYNDFLWQLKEEKPCRNNKVLLVFKRGETQCIDRKALKQINRAEEAYKQIEKTKVPVSFIISLVFFAAFFALTFVTDVSIFKLIFTALYSVCIICAIIGLLSYIVVMCLKPKLLKHCVDQAQKYNVILPGQIVPNIIEEDKTEED